MSSLNDQVNKLFAPKTMPDLDMLLGDVDGTNAVLPESEAIDDHLMEMDAPSYKGGSPLAQSGIDEGEDDGEDHYYSDVEDEFSDADEEVKEGKCAVEENGKDIVQKDVNTDKPNDDEKTRSVKFQLEISEKLFDLHAQAQKIMTAINRLPTSTPAACQADSERKAVEGKLQEHFLRLRRIRAKIGSSLEEEEYSESPAEITSKLAGSLFVEDVKRFEEQRNRTLQAWYERTRAPLFAMLEVPILQAISQALQDPSKLIRRTQLKRFKGDIIGKAEQQQAAAAAGQDIYDEEIFDDNDFFYSLLERSFWKSNRTVVMSACPQRNVPSSFNHTKKPHFPSKGKLLRFNVHPKLVNFYCPDPSIEAGCSFVREALLDAIRNN